MGREAGGRREGVLKRGKEQAAGVCLSGPPELLNALSSGNRQGAWPQDQKSMVTRERRPLVLFVLL